MCLWWSGPETPGISPKTPAQWVRSIRVYIRSFRTSNSWNPRLQKSKDFAMGFAWNLSQRFLHKLGWDTLKIITRNLQYWEIGRFEVQSTFETVESTGTSNPKPPRSFRRGGEPYFKDWRTWDGRKDVIAPRAREGERRRERAAAVVKKTWRTVYPRPPVVYIGKFNYPEYPASGPENPDLPETPGIRPETLAPPQTEQKKTQKNLI